MHVHPKVVSEASQMFARFARFEYALKRSGFSKRGKKTDAATGAHSLSPDWEKFKDLKEVKNLWGRASTDPRVKYLIDNPAKIYMSNGAQMGLGHTPSSPTSMPSLIDMVLRVRNNLFHGDKQAVGLERDTDLLLACLVMIDLMLDARTDVRLEYETQSAF